MTLQFNKSLEVVVPASKPCGLCKGTKINPSVWHYDPKNPDASGFGPGPCEKCQSTGIITRPDFDAIFAIVTKQTKAGKISLRASKPKFQNEFLNLSEGRAYYVWRTIRFHGGIDVTMPIIAGMALQYDPYMDELDSFASSLARAFCGTDKAAMYRWLNALGHNIPVPDNQPATAFSCGPVVTGNKPVEELPEMS